MAELVTELTAPWPARAALDDGRLVLGGIDAAELAQRVGTPAYVVDEVELRARAREYVEAFATHPGGAQVVFATKAFPCTAVIRALHEEGLGADVASAGELYLARKAGVPGSQIVVHGNAKTTEDLQAALDAEAGLIVLDSADELDRLSSLAIASGVRQRVLIRVTPDVRGATHDKISTGQADSKFGVAPAVALELRARIERELQSSIAFEGWHLHIGSQLLELEVFDRGIRAVAALGPVRVLDVGGGLGVAYEPGQEAPTIAAYAKRVLEVVRKTAGPDVQLIVEAGRSVSARAGVTLYTVQTVKRNVSTWVAVDGGMADNLRPMLYGATFDARLVDRDSTGGEICKLAGRHCESGDTLIERVALSDPRPGDVVAVATTGAYTFATANTYNGIPRAPVVFVSDGDHRVVVRRETIEELADRDVE